MKATRYHHVVDEVLKRKAQTFLEVGTWNGDRAVEVFKAVNGQWPIVYYGFDLFEDMTPEKALEEFNVKRPYSFEEVVNRLAMVEGVETHLYRGNTVDTLRDFTNFHTMLTMDVVWIDGGHSINTIVSDWVWCQHLVKKDGVMLLDDYYSGAAVRDGFGCNALVEILQDRKASITPWNVQILPEIDPVWGGGGVQIVKVTRG